MFDFILQCFINSNLKIKSFDKLKEYISFCLSNNVEKEKFKTEHHHILLRSLFPEYSDLKNYSWNGVHLKYENHYIAHALLCDSGMIKYKGYKMIDSNEFNKGNK